MYDFKGFLKTFEEHLLSFACVHGLWMVSDSMNN